MKIVKISLQLFIVSLIGLSCPSWAAAQSADGAVESNARVNAIDQAFKAARSTSVQSTQAPISKEKKSLHVVMKDNGQVDVIPTQPAKITKPVEQKVKSVNDQGRGSYRFKDDWTLETQKTKSSSEDKQNQGKRTLDQKIQMVAEPLAPTPTTDRNFGYVYWDPNMPEYAPGVEPIEQAYVPPVKKEPMVKVPEVNPLPMKPEPVKMTKFEPEPVPEYSSSTGSFSKLFDHNNPLIKWEFAPETFFYRYEEPNLMRNEGMMYGVTAAYTYRTRENEHVSSLKEAFSGADHINMFRLDAMYGQGEVDYESNGTGTDDNIPDFMGEIRLVAGEDIPVFRNTLITPYAGMGFRYLRDDSSGRATSTGHWGYNRENFLWYLPLGIDVEKPLKSDWQLGLNAEYDLMIDGTQISHLDAAEIGGDEITNDQNRGSGLRGSFRITKMTDQIDLFVEPFVRYWRIADSDVQSGWIEPKNNTHEYGLKLGIRY